jgi:hypothetical protein
MPLAAQPEAGNSATPPATEALPTLPLEEPPTLGAEPSTQLTAPPPALGAPAPTNSSLVSTSGEQCPGCGALMASDQRYCLECGQRRGEPRLPFMNAVVLMDTVVRGPRTAATPPPPRRRKRLSANATLIAGIGTLLLALGVGVLIGRSGTNSNPAASTTPVVVKVPGNGEASTSAQSNAGGSSGVTSGAKANKGSAGAATGSSGQSRGAEEVLKPAKGVKLPPPKAKLGEKCAGGTAGCKHGKFTGEFFGP